MQEITGKPPGTPPDTPLGLLRQAMHLLAVWTPRWTPEMAQLKTRATALANSIEASPVPRTTAESAHAELQAKAARYDRLKAIALASNPEREGFRVGARVFANFDEAFDAELEAARLERIEAEAGTPPGP